MSKIKPDRENIHQFWPGDRMPLGIPLLQLLFAVTLDFLQIFKSETLKPLIEAGEFTFTDVPYEAAIAAAGALFAGIIGIITSLCPDKRILRVIYATSSFLGEFYCTEEKIHSKQSYNLHVNVT